MGTMNKPVSITFISLGIIFLALILVGIGFYLAISLGMMSTPFSSGTPKAEVTTVTPTNTHTNTGTTTTTSTSASESIPINLSDSQKSALSALGIDPSTIPASISPSQVTCFEGKLGVARVAEIKAGATPSAMDFFKAKSCIN